VAAHATQQWRYFAGTDDQRLAAFNEVLAGDADIVFFSRGGFGVSRLLHRIDWSRVAASGKIFCGFSDITTFCLAALAQANYVTFSGPLAAVDFANSPKRSSLDCCWRHVLSTPILNA
jgi:muramoyltetrapeptide carboxypeptidase